MKKFLATASGIFGALPGVSVMLSEIGTPPDYGKLFGAIIQACGVLALVLLYFNRSSLSNFRPSFLTKWSIGLMISAFVFLAVYLLLLEYCVVTVQPYKPVYFPMAESGDLAEMVRTAGSRAAAILRYGRDAVETAIDQMPAVAKTLTTICLLFLYQGVFTL